jgi:DNA-binding transcriptional LysR family regulator
LKIRHLQDLEVFVCAAEKGGLSAAARMLDLSPAVASAALKRLEADVQTALFVRTTRSMRLTLEGERLLARCRPLLEGLREAEEELLGGHAIVQGRLQLSMPSDLGRHVILPWLNDFQARHPRIRLRLQMSDRLADVYREPVDIAIRYGRPPDSGMVALPLVTENRRVLCAAPSYLARHGTPSSPRELAGHNCLCFTLDETVYNRWRFWKDGEEIDLEVHGDRVADDSDVVRRWALDGHGIAYRSPLDIGQDVAAGRLRVLCAGWQGENAPLYLMFADRRQLSPTVRLLREFLVARCGELQPALPAGKAAGPPSCIRIEQ